MIEHRVAPVEQRGNPARLNMSNDLCVLGSTNLSIRVACHGRDRNYACCKSRWGDALSVHRNQLQLFKKGVLKRIKIGSQFRRLKRNNPWFYTINSLKSAAVSNFGESGSISFPRSRLCLGRSLQLPSSLHGSDAKKFAPTRLTKCPALAVHPNFDRGYVVIAGSLCDQAVEVCRPARSQNIRFRHLP